MPNRPSNASINNKDQSSEPTIDDLLVKEGFTKEQLIDTYKRMLLHGTPPGAVIHRMKKDGVKSSKIPTIKPLLITKSSKPPKKPIKQEPNVFEQMATQAQQYYNQKDNSQSEDENSEWDI